MNIRLVEAADGWQRRKRWAGVPYAVQTAKAIGPRGLLPGAIAGGVAFTALITVGTGLITHQLKNASATYGTFGTVIGIVAFLLLLAKPFGGPSGG